MSIGEPQLGPPEFIRDEFDNFEDWGRFTIGSNSKVKKFYKNIFE